MQQGTHPAARDFEVAFLYDFPEVTVVTGTIVDGAVVRLDVSGIVKESEIPIAIVFRLVDSQSANGESVRCSRQRRSNIFLKDVNVHPPRKQSRSAWPVRPQLDTAPKEIFP
jgi:hypothetical protein